MSRINRDFPRESEGARAITMSASWRLFVLAFRTYQGATRAGDTPAKNSN
jgi:hypothetical protein